MSFFYFANIISIAFTKTRESLFDFSVFFKSDSRVYFYAMEIYILSSKFLKFELYALLVYILVSISYFKTVS